MCDASHPEAGRVKPLEELVVVVDPDDRTLGVTPKLAAHVSGTLHRAFSVVVADGEGRILLQQRAADKYHSGGLWSNSCCGHPRPGEHVADAAARRLEEEMGIRCALEVVGTVQYRAALPNGLVEHEVDHVFVAHWRGEPTPDPVEVAAWSWAHLAAVRLYLAIRPDRYTAWLAPVLARAREHPLLQIDASSTA